MNISVNPVATICFSVHSHLDVWNGGNESEIIFEKIIKLFTGYEELCFLKAVFLAHNQKHKNIFKKNHKILKTFDCQVVVGIIQRTGRFRN